jgi:hypothetical protein
MYRIADPLVRFHQLVRHPRAALFEDRRGAEAWADAQPAFESLVLGPHFEHLARLVLASACGFTTPRRLGSARRSSHGPT